jgi:hypothetical protein
MSRSIPKEVLDELKREREYFGARELRMIGEKLITWLCLEKTNGSKAEQTDALMKCNHIRREIVFATLFNLTDMNNRLKKSIAWTDALYLEVTDRLDARMTPEERQEKANGRLEKCTQMTMPEEIQKELNATDHYVKGQLDDVGNMLMHWHNIQKEKNYYDIPELVKQTMLIKEARNKVFFPENLQAAKSLFPRTLAWVGALHDNMVATQQATTMYSFC